MATLTTVNHKDLEFLLQLDKKLHYTEEPTSEGMGPILYGNDEYTDSSMNIKEIQEVLEILERSNLAFYPINTCSGFAVGYRVTNPERKEETEEALLTFKESQLPKGYTFKRLSEYFMKPENLERAKLLGEEIVNNRSHYEY